MNIQQFSKVTKISVYTIRYYEKIGLLRHIGRNSSGHRYFTKDDIVWAEFIMRLKDTGMSLQNIQAYADLREEGEHTSKLRMKLLQEHANILEKKITVELLHLEKLKEKIDFYDNVIKK